jgi:hypothetical protein
MRWFIFVLVLTAGSATAAEPRELLTAPDAVASAPIAWMRPVPLRLPRSQDRLRELGCLRSPAGIPATLLSGSAGTFTWSVRYRPQGMSGGITLWGRPHAFTLPDGSALPTLKAER